MEDYDYGLYTSILETLMESSYRDPDDLEIGVDISSIPEVKIIFDGYGASETEDKNGEYVYDEHGNTNLESYAIFIHKDSGQDEFVFPEHDFTPFCLIHRPSEEVCIYAWYDVELEEWSIHSIEETSEHKMTNEELMNILIHLRDKYFNDEE